MNTHSILTGFRAQLNTHTDSTFSCRPNLNVTHLLWKSYISCMLPNMMCSLLAMPGGISSTPMVISNRYV